MGLSEPRRDEILGELPAGATLLRTRSTPSGAAIERVVVTGAGVLLVTALDLRAPLRVSVPDWNTPGARIELRAGLRDRTPVLAQSAALAREVATLLHRAAGATGDDHGPTLWRALAELEVTSALCLTRAGLASGRSSVTLHGVVVATPTALRTLLAIDGMLTEPIQRWVADTLDQALGHSGA